jgi:hypothetical protein
MNLLKIYHILIYNKFNNNNKLMLNNNKITYPNKIKISNNSKILCIITIIFLTKYKKFNHKFYKFKLI